MGCAADSLRTIYLGRVILAPVTALAITLVVLGFLISVTGGVLTYRGRMRPSKHPGFYTVPDHGPWTLILTLAGAVVALAGGLLGVLT